MSALALLTPVYSAIGETVLPQNMNNTRFTHWSQYATFAGTIVAAVAAIASIVLSLYPMFIVCGLLCIINAISTYYLKQFAPMHDIDDIVKDLARKAKAIFTQVKDLGAVEKHATQQLKSLEEQLEKERKHKEDLEKLRKEGITKLEAATSQLATVSERCTDMEERQKTIHEDTLKTVSTVQQFMLTQAKVEQSAESVKKATEDLAETAKKLDSVKHRSDKNTVNLRDEISKLTKLFEQLIAKHTEQSNQNAALQAEVKRLSEVQGDTIKAAAQLKESTSTLHATGVAASTRNDADRKRLNHHTAVDRSKQLESDAELSKNVNELIARLPPRTPSPNPQQTPSH